MAQSFALSVGTNLPSLVNVLLARPRFPQVQNSARNAGQNCYRKTLNAPHKQPAGNPLQIRSGTSLYIKKQVATVWQLIIDFRNYALDKADCLNLAFNFFRVNLHKRF